MPQRGSSCHWACYAFFHPSCWFERLPVMLSIGPHIELVDGTVPPRDGNTTANSTSLHGRQRLRGGCGREMFPCVALVGRTYYPVGRAKRGLNGRWLVTSRTRRNFALSTTQTVGSAGADMHVSPTPPMRRMQDEFKMCSGR